MIKILLFLLVLTTCIDMSASKRTDKEMRNIAEKQLYKSKRTNTRGESENIRKLADNTYYNIYGTDGSFVIVSKDSNQPPVIAYSNTSYTEGRVPCGMQWWLSAINAAMEQSAINATVNTRGEAVKPLLQTEWGQGDPFNSLCPTLKGVITPSGCVATAMSQILNYFRYPETGKGVSSYTVLGGFRPWSLTYGMTYNYDLLKNKYDSITIANLTEGEREAISTLLLHCGAAVKMNYNADGSGSNIYDATDGMATFFRYDSLSIKCHHREHFTNEEWMKMLKDELKANHPIFYIGQDSRYGGHAFIIDGINDEGLVHVNWGWDGECNGYYAIDGLTPKRTVGFAYGYNFSHGQSMIIGYKLQEIADQYDSYSSLWATSTPYTLTVSGNNFIIKNIGGLYNYNWLPFEGSIALVFEEDKENGQQYKVTLDEKAFENYKGIRLWGFSIDELDAIPFAWINNTQIPTGNYKVFIGSKDVKEQNFQPLRCGEYTGKIYYSVTKRADDSFIIDPVRKQYTTDIRSISINTVTNKYIYDLNGRNMGTDLNVLRKGIYIIGGKKLVKSSHK